MASDPKSLQRLSRITSGVDRAAGRETARRLDELERRIAFLERAGARPPGAEVDSIRVRALEGRMADGEASVKAAREEVRDLKLRVEGVSTETAARINTHQISLQEARRLLEERAGPMKMLEVEMRQEAARAENARQELRRWMEGAEPVLRGAAEVAEALGPEGAARLRQIPEALQGLGALGERLQRVEQGVGQVAAQAEGLVKAGEEAAALFEELKQTVEPWRGGPAPAALEARLAALEKESGKWEDLGEVLLSLREGLGALQKGAAELQGKGEVLDLHGKEIQHLAAVADDLRKAVEEVRRGPALPPEVQRLPAMEGRMDRLEKEAERFAELGEVLLRLREGVEGLQKEAARLEAIEKRTGALELDRRDLARLNEAVEGLLGEVEALKGGSPEAARLAGVEKRVGEQEAALQKMSGVAEEVLKWMDSMDEQRKVVESALQTLKESPVEKRLDEAEMAQAKASGAIEHLLKQVDELEAGLERVRRVVMQQSGQKGA